MTQHKAFWVRCPKCWNFALVGAGLPLSNISTICRCGTDISKNVKETKEDYKEFTRLLTEISDCIIKNKLYGINEKLMELHGLYNKVVIA